MFQLFHKAEKKKKDSRQKRLSDLYAAIKKDEGSNRDIGTPSGTYDCLSE